MKKYFLLFLVLISVLFTACIDETKSEEAKKVIKVGTSGGYFPFTYYENDVLKGFEIDVWNAIGENLGVTIEFKTAKFSGLFGMLETKKIDTISNQITKTDARTVKYDFADAYVYDGAQIIVHQDNNSINSLEDLKGKKIGVGLGTNYADIIREFDTNNEIEIISYDGNGFQNDVKLKRIDAYIEDRTSAVESIKKANLPLKIVGSPIRVLSNAFPFLKSENNLLLKDVNTALSALRKDGKLKEISLKWFNMDITNK
ncbi:MAG: amino acid ABC transporter substrate-binding protein [Halarcobacter sp.]